MSVDMGFQIVPPEPTRRPARRVAPIVVGVIGAISDQALYAAANRYIVVSERATTPNPSPVSVYRAP